MLKPDIDVRKVYREVVGQTTSSHNPDAPQERQHKRADENYESYMRKLALGQFEKFNGMDLVYFFRDMSREAGYKYSISSIHAEAGCMKRMLEDYGPVEICGIIRFIFKSGQDYINKATCSPYLISGNWRNTLYPDSQAWAAGEYGAKKSKHIKRREWGEKKQHTAVQIGVWDG